VATKVWTGAKDSNWADAANWNPAVVPVGGDDVVLIDNDVDIDTGLDQSLVTLASLKIDATYRGKIGTMTAYLQVDPNTCWIGRSDGTGEPTGSTQIKLDFGAVAGCDTIIYSSSSVSAMSNCPPICLIGDHAAHVFEIRSGSVGFALGPLETSESCSRIHVGFVGDNSAGPDVIVGGGMTPATLVVNSGKCSYNGPSLATGRCHGGELTLDTIGAVTNLTVRGGVCYPNAFTTLTACNAHGGMTDFTQTDATRTVTAMNFYRGGSVNWSESSGRFTLTNGVIQEAMTLTGLEI